MIIDKDAIPTKLLWVDLEMTGLNPAKDGILEVAALVTDFSLQKLASFEAVVKQSDEVLASMNDWATAQHAKSGLTERVRHDGRPSTEVEQEFAEFISTHFGHEPAVLAGNSIYNDRNFITQWWPAVAELLHYRMIDVSSFKVVMQGAYNLNFTKKETHRALSDIEESIMELAFYLDWMKEQHD